jgi:hypothetical protein
MSCREKREKAIIPEIPSQDLLKIIIGKNAENPDRDRIYANA